MTYLLYDTALNGDYTLVILRQQYPDSVSLFEGTKDESLADIAPYLFQIDGDARYLDSECADHSGLTGACRRQTPHPSPLPQGERGLC